MVVSECASKCSIASVTNFFVKRSLMHMLVFAAHYKLHDEIVALLLLLCNTDFISGVLDAQYYKCNL